MTEAKSDQLSLYHLDKGKRYFKENKLSEALIEYNKVKFLEAIFYFPCGHYSLNLFRLSLMLYQIRI